MIINGRPVADGMGTGDLQRLASRRGEEVGQQDGFTNLAFGMMSEQEWEQFKQMAADGNAKATSYAQQGDARWDAWARENSVLAWLSSPDAAQRSTPSPADAALPVESAAAPTPSADAAPAATVAPGGAAAFVEADAPTPSVDKPAAELPSTQQLLDELAMSLRFAGNLARRSYEGDV